MKKVKILGILLIMLAILSNCSNDDDNKENTNATPEARNLDLVKGTTVLTPGSVLIIRYDYYDAENDAEGNTLFKWYRSDSQSGVNKGLISGATQATYNITSADTDKYLSAEVTPVQSDGRAGKTVASGYSSLVSNQTTSWDGESITTYNIVNDEFIKTYDHPVSSQYISWQTETAKHQEIIEQFKKIVPKDFYNRISEFTLYLGKVGSFNTLGRVSYIPNKRNTFKFELAIDNAYDAPFNSELGVNYTIAHEFGHVLTLNDSQASVTESNQNTCNNYFDSNCFYSNSYLNIFYQDYWVPILSDYNNAGSYVAYYNAHKNEFVSEYAASHTAEDIAETIMMYVLNSVNFTGTTIADQKVKSMDSYTDLQNIKTFATNNIPNSHLRGQTFDFSKRKGFVCGTTAHKH